MAESEKKSETSPGDVPGPSGQRVLVVDDYADNRELYTEYLSFMGFEVDTAADGVEALQRVQEGAPDVILMDLSLPLMSGWEAIRHLKADPQTGDIPVLALTGHAMPAHMAHAMAVGADGFVTKPCLPQEVEDRLRALLKGARRKGET